MPKWGYSPVKRVEYRIDCSQSWSKFFRDERRGTSSLGQEEKKGKTRNIEHSRRDNAGRKNWGKEPDLGSQVVYVVENCLIRRIVETTLNSRSFIFCESRT